MKLRLIVILFFFFGNSIAQNKVITPIEKNAINKYIVFANHSNHYLNTISNILNQYNLKLNRAYESIATNPNSGTVALEKQKFRKHLININFDIEKEYQKAKAFKKKLPKKRYLLLDQELDKIYKHILRLAAVYKKLQNKTKDEIFNDLSFKSTQALLKQASYIGDAFLDTNYAFSIASVIFYGEQTELTPLLKFLNFKVAGTKDVIMGVRQTNKENVALFYNNFSKKSNYKITQKDMDQLNDKGIQISLLTFQEKYYAPFSTSLKKIALLTSSYLNKTQANQSIKTLSKLIKEFDYQADKSGIAHLYNDLVSQSTKLNYKLFVEEPLPYVFWLPKNYTKSLQIETTKPTKIATAITSEKSNVKTSTTVNQHIKNKRPKVFEKENTKTLYGARYNNLVFLLDVSRSMHQDDKLPLLKNSLVDLVNIMRPEDKIAIIIYSGESKVILETATIANKDVILKAINNLSSAGSTNVTAGLRLAYASVLKSFSNNSNNKIILATDGDFKITTYLNKLITKNTQNNIDLSIFHYGKDTHIDNLNNLEKIATLGNGNFKHIETKADATKALILEAKKKK